MEQMFKEFLNSMNYKEFILFLLNKNINFEEVKDGKFNLLKCNGFIIKFSDDIFINIIRS